MSSEIETEILVELLSNPNPLARPPRAASLSPSQLDDLLSRLPRRPTLDLPGAGQIEPLDLGFDQTPTPDSEAVSAEEAESTEADDALEEPDEGLDDSDEGLDDSDEGLDDSDEGLDDSAARAAERSSTRLARNVRERIRALSTTERQKLARIGDQTERVALERMFGKAVWEGLLRNPKLTSPEVARIARMGALPQPLLEVIVANRSFLSSPQVRRALLANRRLKKDMVMTVLRATPKSELKLMPKQMGYPPTVRQAAAKLLK